MFDEFWTYAMYYKVKTSRLSVICTYYMFIFEYEHTIKQSNPTYRRSTEFILWKYFDNSQENIFDRA